MKILAKYIDMLSWGDQNGNLHPIRFRYSAEDERNVVIKVDKVIQITKENIAGNNMLVFRCQSIICVINKLFELKYEISNCKWILFKIE